MKTIPQLFPTFAGAFKAKRTEPTNGVTNVPRMSYRQWQGASARGNWGNGWFLDMNGLAGVNDWNTQLGNVGLNSLYQICMRWIAMQSVQAPLRYQEPDEKNDGQFATILTGEQFGPAWLLQQPHPILSMPDIVGRTCCDLARGNAYWLIGKNNGSAPRQLWWFPREWWQWVIQEDWSVRYRLTIPGGGIQEFDASDVIHFRLPASDPEFPFLGEDPIIAQARHLCVDNEAGQYTHAVLKNFGVSPVIIAWKDRDTRPTEPAILSAIQKFKERATGERRGEPNIFPAEAEVTELNNSPEKMALDKITRTPEERVTAALGLNPIALQLGAGLEQSTYSNITEARRAAWDEGIAPLHHIIQRTLTEKLLPLFGAMPAGVGAVSQAPTGRFWFDYADVPALQEDEAKLFERANSSFKTGAMTMNELRMARRQKPLDETDPRGALMVHEIGGQAAPAEPDAPQTLEAKSMNPTEHKAADDESPAPLPDPHGVAFTDEELDALTDTDNEESVKLAYAKAGQAARELLAADVLDAEQ